MNFTFTPRGKLHKREGSERLQRRVMVQQDGETVTPNSRAYHKKTEENDLRQALVSKNAQAVERFGNSRDALHAHAVSHGVTIRQTP